MAETGKDMMEKSLFGLAMTAPGIAFTALGASVVLRPSVPPRLVAAACLPAGGAMLATASFMRGAGARPARAG